MFYYLMNNCFSFYKTSVLSVAHEKFLFITVYYCFYGMIIVIGCMYNNNNNDGFSFNILNLVILKKLLF